MRVLVLASILALLACGQTAQPPIVRNLDRPSEMAFACYGGLRVDGAELRTAQPLASCVARAAGEVPSGQEDVDPPTTYGFALETARGTVSVIDASPGINAVVDGDPLTPGKNSIPIGTLPVGIQPDSSGCYMVTANAGTCDLSELEINSTIEPTTPARISRVPVATSAGPLLARPHAMATHAQEAQIGAACPASATGLVYVAYPGCNLVAAVDAGTGAVRGGVQFCDGGQVSVVGPDVTCPVECGDGALQPIAHGGMMPDAGPDPDAGPVADGVGRPVAVTFGPDGRLYIGADNQSRVVVATLDGAGLPTAVDSIALEGEVGVSRIAVSNEVAIGGAGEEPGGGAARRYAYAIASDASVRVVDLTLGVECDAQVDPRALREETDPARLACLPVGAPDTPPRRATARSPGIVLPRGALPLDVAFADVDPADAVSAVAPFNLLGTFAFVTTSDGLVAVVNVDDDRYPDVEDADSPLAVQLPLAMPHQLRDLVRDRAAVRGEEDTCEAPAADTLEGSPRLGGAPVVSVSEERIASGKTGSLPSVHAVLCDPTTEAEAAAVAELAYAAPPAVREQAFPDLAAVRNETWIVSWEGPLSIDSATTEVDGPPVRRGVIAGAELIDREAPFCQAGLEPFDIVTLVGCDPTLGEAQCGVGETCYVHPDSPAEVTSGQCLPTEKVDELSGRCRDFLIGVRRYSAAAVTADGVTLLPRRRLLRTSPLDGCTSDAQCREMAAIDAGLAEPEHPIDLPGEPQGSWVCGADPTRAPGVDRCMMSCETDDDCAAGTLCESGFCVEGALPPPDCVSTVQRYQLRVGDAMVVIGDRSGYLHRRVREEGGDACVVDPASSPLLVGRLPLRAPPCTDAASPNPCATTVEQTERVIPYALDGDTCEAGDPVLRARQAPAIRFENPAVRFHLVDLETTGDAACIGDRAGTAPPFTTVFPGFAISLPIVAGYAPMTVPTIEAALPIRLAASPDGRFFVVDQGDASAVTNGRIFSFEPAAAASGFDVPPVPIFKD